MDKIIQKRGVETDDLRLPCLRTTDGADRSIGTRQA